mmetsp:Transcript_46084/g.152782  ORF Transcript_46084/g.152782 Transcript_46084/m.152782 type:complete len:211 (+) Transcript_46084:2369-3001(+)
MQARLVSRRWRRWWARCGRRTRGETSRPRLWRRCSSCSPTRRTRPSSTLRCSRTRRACFARRSASARCCRRRGTSPSPRVARPGSSCSRTRRPTRRRSCCRCRRRSPRRARGRRRRSRRRQSRLSSPPDEGAARRVPWTCRGSLLARDRHPAVLVRDGTWAHPRSQYACARARAGKRGADGGSRRAVCLRLEAPPELAAYGAPARLGDVM